MCEGSWMKRKKERCIDGRESVRRHGNVHSAAAAATSGTRRKRHFGFIRTWIKAIPPLEMTWRQTRFAKQSLWSLLSISCSLSTIISTAYPPCSRPQCACPAQYHGPKVSCNVRCIPQLTRLRSSVKTYGKRPGQSSSSSSFLFSDSSIAPCPSSPPSFRLVTPVAASPIRDPFTPDHDDGEMPSSPLTSKRRQLDVLGGGDFPVRRIETGMAKLEKGDALAQSSLRGFFAPLPRVKLPLHPCTTIPSTDVSTSLQTKPGASSKPPSVSLKSSLTQSHLTHLPLLHTCRDCAMSYVRGGGDDGLHAKHHAKITRGIIWDGLGKGKGKGKVNGQGWRVAAEDVRFGQGRETGKGRIVVCGGSWGGQKVSEATGRDHNADEAFQLDDILNTVDTVLSAPPLPEAILDQCNVFLFLTSSPPPTSAKRSRPIPGSKRKDDQERVVSVVVAQPIKVAMRVLRPGEDSDVSVVDSGGGVVCE